MNTPEPVKNARESFGEITFDVDDALSHVILDEPLTYENNLTETVEIIVPAGVKLKYSYLDYFNGEWMLHVYHDDEGYELPLSQHEVREWVYDSDVPEKAERAEELLEEAQGLLDDIWGETGDTDAENLTKRVLETREKLQRDYL